MASSHSSDAPVLRIPRPPFDSAPFPDFKPVEVGHVSRDSGGNMRRDRSQLASLTITPLDLSKNLNWDLSDGFDIRVDKYTDQVPGQHLLWWIREDLSGRGGETLQARIEADIVCTRGRLTKLATPSAQSQGWLLGTVRYGNVLFFAEFKTESEKQYCASVTERDKKMAHWGDRFERYVAQRKSTTTTTTTNSEVVVDCNERFYAVFRAQLNRAGRSSSTRLRLLYSAEIDCVDESSGEYVELKTTSIIDSGDSRREGNFKRFKLLKWWAQSSLAGINRVVCGCRNNAGFVQYLKEYNVADIPKQAKDSSKRGAPMWSSAVCMNFLYDVLRFIDTNSARPDRPDAVSGITVFEYDPKLKLVRLVKTHDFTNEDVLPEWFVSCL